MKLLFNTIGGLLAIGSFAIAGLSLWRAWGAATLLSFAVLFWGFGNARKP